MSMNIQEIKFNEIETCQYEGEMRFPYFCDPDRRLIFPILTQNGKPRARLDLLIIYIQPSL